MKIKDDLMLRKIADEWVIVPMGERLLEFNGMMKVNNVGAFFWQLLEKGATKEEIITALLNEYEVDQDVAAREVDVFIKTLSDARVLEA